MRLAVPCPALEPPPPQVFLSVPGTLPPSHIHGFPMCSSCIFLGKRLVLTGALLDRRWQPTGLSRNPRSCSVRREDLQRGKWIGPLSPVLYCKPLSDCKSVWEVSALLPLADGANGKEAKQTDRQWLGAVKASSPAVAFDGRHKNSSLGKGKQPSWDGFQTHTTVGVAPKW